MLKQVVVFLGALLLAGTIYANPEVGKAAPQFEMVDIYGNPFNLADQKGKTVVLEWTNHKCPYVVKHYSTNNMQNAQKTATANDDVVWVSIVSSAEGKQGHLSVEEAQAIIKENGSNETTRLLDESGDVGRMYGAKTTPHMFIINPEGELVYKGAIDDNSSSKPSTVEGANNYVLAALQEMKEGKAISNAQTKPYGCGIKY